VDAPLVRLSCARPVWLGGGGKCARRVCLPVALPPVYLSACVWPSAQDGGGRAGIGNCRRGAERQTCSRRSRVCRQRAHPSSKQRPQEDEGDLPPISAAKDSLPQAQAAVSSSRSRLTF